MNGALQAAAAAERDAKEQEFNRLYARYERLVHATAYAIVKDRYLAQDIAQEVFLNIYARLDSVREAANPEAWMTAVARNKAIDYRRKAFGRVLLTDRVERWSAGAADGPDRASAVADALRLIMRLDPLLRQPLLLIYAHDLTYEQIARVQRLTVAAVKTRIHRARKQLRAMARE
ncbi:RNA polymerase sigma factor [Paenibacillus sp. MWE-103]|uniref:RNA polymerase sigma factor n=1 Tax=Paenibacillus artemisiicola TaxID=1172618 RepID=A0ABS3WGR8_9BACL|nr:RNA polymerase sigma factor [Paenibacillus artemisiicola]MBO7747325.1 RNA polymerase sigma factor [Paenibacillus artemisiicola]